MTVTSWSYSALAQYELCPAQYRYQRIDKLPTKSKPHLEKGNRVHKSLENFVRARGAFPAALDKDVTKELGFITELAALDAPKQIEQEWGFTRGWLPVSWRAATFRAKLDVLVDYLDGAMEAVDWKTGKKYASNHDQMELFGATVMHRFPSVQQVTTRLVYVEAGGQEIADHSRDDLQRVTSRWEARAEHLFIEQSWRPRPNDKCFFCDFGKAKGGPCRYG